MAKRTTPEINSAGMADIAFLLLIFFLVATTLATDKGLTLLLPPKPDDTEIIDIEIPERNLFKVLVNSQDRVLVENEPVKDVTEIREMAKKFILNFGNPKSPEAIELYNSLPGELKVMVERVPESSDNPKDAIVSFKADRGTSYEMYIAILDELQGAYYEIYGARVGLSADEFRKLDRKKPEEKAKYERAREGMPMNISIAEPTKVGG